MKRILPVLLLSVAVTSSMAQKVGKAKALLELKKLQDARTQIDNALLNPKLAEDPDAYYVKAKIYSAIAEDSILRGSMPDARDQAFEALKQYVALDKKGNGKHIALQLDQYRPPYEIYFGYYNTGAAFYNSSNFNDAFTNFKKGLEISNFARENNWKNAPAPLYLTAIDTNLVTFTGIAAERSNKRDSAAYYYGLLADKKINTAEMLDIYKWLVDFYNHKKDSINIEKYLALGKELYPNDSYWTSMELEIASNSGDKTVAYKKYEEMLAKEPTNSVYPYNYGVEIYRDIYSVPLNERPADFKEQIAKAADLIRKSLELNPTYIQANLVLGQILYNQGVELSSQQRAFKQGVANSRLTPEEIKQKEDLKTEMFNKFNEAIPFLEKVSTALDSKEGALSSEDKRTLKSSYDLLTTIYENKQTEKDVTEVQKAEYKKKMDEYQNKVNSVDSRH